MDTTGRRGATGCAVALAAGVIVAVTGAPASAVPGPALAGPPLQSARATQAGWHRYHAQPFTAAAGTLCPFELHSQVLFDQEYVRTTRTYADGSPRTQQFVGPLVVRVTNTATRRSVRRDLSGRAIVQYARNGSFTYYLQGPVAVGFHPGDSLAPGYYVLRGEHTVHFAADGTRTLTADRGSEENLCHTLR